MAESRMQSQIYQYDDESENRLLKKSKDSPFFPIAIGLCALSVAYGAYAYKNRGKMSTSVYLMQLRVGAQGVAVAALTAGLVYNMVNEHILKKN